VKVVLMVIHLMELQDVMRVFLHVQNAILAIQVVALPALINII
jgi:hypothetical protein